MSTPEFRKAENPIARNHHNKRESKSGKLASTQTQSPAFLSTYVEWRNSRLEALPANRKVDRWHEAMVNDNIWHRWFLAGIVESEIMISRSALAHIYDNVKAKTAGTSPSVGSAKRGPLGLHRARSARIQIRHSISCELIRFPLGSCAIGGRRDNPEDPPGTSRCLQPDRCSRGPRCGLRSPRHIGRGLSPERRRGGGGGCPC
jgi:hypothetical protein